MVKSKCMYSAQKAFTLIELLIVVSLITVITGAVVPSFNGYIENQNKKQALEQVKDDLRTTQNRALNGENSNTRINDVSEPLYWGLNFTQMGTTYDTFYSIENDDCPPANNIFYSTSSILAGDNVIRSVSGCIFFSFDNGDANFVDTTGIIIVGPDEGQDNNNCKRLEVHSNGFIEEGAGVQCV